MMTTKFCVLNFKTGLYDEYKTKNEAIIAVTNNAFDSYMEHVHQNPISIVKVLEDGSEIWTSTNGDDISTDMIKAKLQEKLVGEIKFTKI